jgi:SsrA-binding protein
MSKAGKHNHKQAPRVENRRAFHDYHIVERLECGISLFGTEVKACREGRCTLQGSFARIEPSGDLVAYNVEIGAYSNAPAAFQHEPKRPRRLLAKRREIADLTSKTTAGSSTTLIPLALYFSDRGLIKMEIGLAVGKSHGDKRESLKKRDSDRDIQRAMTRKRI